MPTRYSAAIDMLSKSCQSATTMTPKRNGARQSRTVLQLTLRLNEAEARALNQIILKRARTMGRASFSTTIRALILEANPLAQ